MNAYFWALLSTVWALVATVIGLLLYRSSKAFFELNNTTPKRSQTIRAAGSIVIAGIAFFAMQRAAPSWIISESPNGVMISHANFADLRSATRRMDNTVLELKACLSIGNTQKSGAQLSDLCNTQLDEVTRLTNAIVLITKEFAQSSD